MKKYLYLLLFIFSQKIMAQKIQLSIVAKADKAESVEFANLIIRNAKDSSLAWSATFKEDGKLTASLKAQQSYYVSISAIGLATQNQLIALANDNKTIEINLGASATALNEVTVKYREKLVRKEDDKEIVDAEPLSKLSSNAFELLEKIPGVIVVDDNIFLGKAEQARIYINGREMKLGSNDLASILKSMPPNSVQKIELLRTPSAKFDASSSGGIINIVLKKGIRLGTNGTLNANFSQGKYARANAGFSVNRGDEKSNIYLNYQYNNRNNFETLSSQRFFDDKTSQLAQNATTTFPAQTHYIAAGIDKTLRNDWNVSDDFFINIENSESNATNENTFENLSKQVKTAQSQGLINNDFTKINLSNTFSTQKKLDTIGSEWNNSLNFILSNSATNQRYANTFVLPQTAATNGNGDIEGQRKVLAFTSDLTKKLPLKVKMELGIKLDFLTNNSTSLFQFNQQSDVKNSIVYDYQENINAGYLQFSRTFNKLTLKTGVRAENTNMLGKQTMPTDTAFKVNRTDLFPYLYVSRDLFSLFKNFMLTGNLIARRSITRPGYEALNPAVQFTDPYYVQSGNPSLKPQFTNTYEFNISFNDYPVLAVGTDDTKDVFGKVVYQNPTSKIFTETYDNLGHLRQYYCRLVGGLPPGGKYFGIVGAMYNYQIYKGLYQGENLDFRRGSWTIFTYHELKLGKNAVLSANGFLRVKGVQNFYELQNLGDLTVTLRQNFFKQKLQVILRANDIFYSMKTNFVLQQGNIDAAGQRFGDTQRIGVTLRYNFGMSVGNKKKKGESENIFDMVNPAKQKVN
jgi:iron complex outermembrane recepter protein